MAIIEQKRHVSVKTNQQEMMYFTGYVILAKHCSRDNVSFSNI